MTPISFLNHKLLKTKEIEHKSFHVGIFLLASAPSLACLFLIFPILIGIKKHHKNLIQNKLNYLILSAGFIMITKSIYTSLIGINEIEGWNNVLNWVGLGNWIPHFIIYFGSQIYVQNQKQRILVAKLLILGTLPVVFSCFSQYLLEWYGPYELFNGFIVWYQRTRTEINQPITGLFNNPNYTGAWLAMIWPFLLSYQFQKKKEGSKYKYLIVFTYCILFIIAISLINSRGAWVGILTSLPLLFGRGVLLWFIPLLVISSLSIIICTLPNLFLNIKNIFCLFIPDNLLTNFNAYSLNLEEIPRLVIWNEAINLTLQKPFFGWGAASFPIIYLSKYGEWKGHPHNLFLELSTSYGLISSILIFTLIGILLLKTFKIIYNSKFSKDYYERAWWISIVVFLILHSFDIVYFDSRISIIFWILLAGLNGIFKQPKII